MKKNYYYLIALLAFVSCSQGETLDTTKNSSGVVDFASLQKFIDTRTNGYFNVISSTTVASQYFSAAEVSGTFAEEENRIQTLSITNSTNTINIGRASIGGIEIGGYKANIRSTEENNYERPEDASHLYGQKIEFVIGKKGSLTKSNPEVVVDSMYIPEKILLQEPKLMYGGDTVYVGQQVKWNADPQNDKGVIILVTYETTGNESFHQTHPNTFFRTIAVADNGSCMLPAELFQGMPKDAFIEVALVRGNFQFTSSKITEDIYSLHTYTRVAYGARYK